ncbi:MAG: hypothetical protein PHO94_13230 [Petrimonas sp.]|nr:hypothetical protein [Petrimonas sp.]
METTNRTFIVMLVKVFFVFGMTYRFIMVMFQFHYGWKQENDDKKNGGDFFVNNFHLNEKRMFSVLFGQR